MFSTTHNSRYFVFLKVSLGLKINFDIQACDCIGIWLHWAHRADSQSLRGPFRVHDPVTSEVLRFKVSHLLDLVVEKLQSWERCNPTYHERTHVSRHTWTFVLSDHHGALNSLPCEQLKDKSEKINYLQKPYSVATKTPFRCSERV